jgi:RNA polymerase sigma factor (sigma-70 family)
MLDLQRVSSEAMSGGRRIGFGGPAPVLEADAEASDCPLSDWEIIRLNCRRHIQRWRIPPHWNRVDWLEEMDAEGAIAALRARDNYDPSTAVPFRIYAVRRVLGQAITRYRKEWSYARFCGDPAIDAFDDKSTLDAESTGSAEEVRQALSNLRDTDRHLLERLFWNEETEAEVAQSLGITQQAVSKRKLVLLRALKRKLGTRWK